MTRRLSVFVMLLLGISSTCFSAPVVIQCPEPLPEFTLRENSRPSKTQVEQLCNCIWNQFPANGWEREAAMAMRKGKDPGFLKRNGFISRFGEALERCGGNQL